MRDRILDWLPLPVIFLSYHLAGLASRRLGRPLCDALLLAWDRRIFGALPGLWLNERLPRAALDLLEFFYFSYYILVPLAPWLLYARDGRRALWRLWVTVGLSYLICDLLFPWFPSTPPRLLEGQFSTAGAMQAINLWILDRFSIGGNVFPSSHVAAAVAFGFAHFGFNRRRGLWFLAWAAGIAAATVSGGYHYGVDVLGGVAVGCAASALALRLK